MITLTEHGKPVYLLGKKERKPQGDPIDMQVKESGESKSLVVTAKIGIDISRENEPTSTWFLITRALEKSLKERKQMAVNFNLLVHFPNPENRRK